MHKLEELKERLCDELAEYSTRKMDAQTLDVIDKLAHTVKNLDKIISENGYSGSRYYNDRGGYSMNRGGEHYRDDMRGGYSMNRDMM